MADELGIGNYSCPLSLPRVKARKLRATVEGGSSNTAVCVEPVKGTVDALRVAASAFGYMNKTEFGSFHVVQAAVVDRAELGDVAQFPDLAPGTEQGSLSRGTKNGSLPYATTPVPLMTVDRIMQDLQLPKIDILTIDTEGFDPAVLKGAKTALRSTRYLEFEVHRDISPSPWHQTTLKSVIDELSEQDFDCFWAGENERLLSINLCWSDRFETRMWSNVACVKRRDPWWDVLRRFAGIGNASTQPL
eukprot:UN0510